MRLPRILPHQTSQETLDAIAAAEASPDRNRPLAGALHILGAAFMFGSLGALVKMASADLPSPMVVFYRNLFSTLFIIPWLLRHPEIGIRTERFHLHLIRGTAGLAAMYCYFFSLSRLVLSEAVLLSFTSPLFIPIIAALWLKEPVPTRVRWAIAIGFFGVILILRPTAGIIDPVAVVGLMAGMFAAGAMVTIRRLSATEPAWRIVFYFCSLATAGSFFPALAVWQWPTGITWAYVVLVGFLATMGQYLLTRGYSLAPAAQVGPFIYFIVVFAAVYGRVLWGESLDVMTAVGAVTIVLACIASTRKAGR